MKKKSFLRFIGAVLTGSILFLAGMRTEAAEHYEPATIYPTCGVVTEIGPAADTVTFTLFNGHMFSFYGCEDWACGDICAAIMANNGTAEITDDVILSVRYCGWVF